ncbi:MAG: carbohydrate ABC transporter permease [Spirochaetales bacterium]|jgi:putative aldouronate transport system permease protein|nr:carbohydrate ABC transporter permease [Spirochaetales bacterium]
MESGSKSYLHRSGSGRLASFIIHFVLILYCLTVFYPFWTTILLSFSGVDEGMAMGFHFWLSEWKTSAYQFISDRYTAMGRIYFNSIFRTAVGTILTIGFTLMAAYPLSKKRLPGRKGMTIYLLVTLFYTGGLIPTYILIRSLGLINTRLVLILPTLTMPYYIIVMRNFLMTIDNSYEEAAFMDGAGYAQILVRIIVPLSLPIIATVALWHAVYHWNAWFDSLIYTTKQSLVVLQLLLHKIVIEAEEAFDNARHDFAIEFEVELPTAAVKSAVTVVTIGPIILLYPFLQRYFISGVFSGSIKG